MQNELNFPRLIAEEIFSRMKKADLERYLLQVNQALSLRNKDGSHPTPQMLKHYRRGKALAEKYLKQSSNATI
jgi:hypothetical protein